MLPQQVKTSARLKNVGPAGEHWVLSVLYRLGLNVIPTPANYPGVDALLQYDNGAFRAIQVKASADVNRNMFLGKTLYETALHVYVLVYFGDASGKSSATRHDRFRDPLILPEVYLVSGLDIRGLTKSHGTVGWVLNGAALVSSGARDRWSVVATPPQEMRRRLASDESRPPLGPSRPV